MATKILVDIHNDVKLLITAITGFEEGEEGFRICEAFALSNVKHHRYLSIDSHATKKAISKLSKKFSIHGKYKVSKKFQDLIHAFLSSFDFEHHPQYDLQWSLLSFLLNLSSETNKSELQCLEILKTSRGEHSLHASTSNESEPTEEIDWREYLMEGQDNFFSNYHSDDSKNEWSEDENNSVSESVNRRPPINRLAKELVCTQTPVKRTQSTLDKLSQYLGDAVESNNWLKKNIQNDWWTTINCDYYPVHSQFPDATFSQAWDKITSLGIQQTGTLSEYQVCREVLWMLHSPAQMALFLQNIEAEFSVKRDVSIPSLSQNAFSGIFSSLCECFTMLRELETFGNGLYPKSNPSKACRRPPLTYEAYHSAVTQHLNKLRQGTIKLEQRLIEQDGCDTLLSILNDLQKYLESVKILYEVHQSIITEWEYQSNWKCASKLLSGIFFQMQNSSSRERANICTSLYLQSLSVYLNIIDTWLSEGRFEDWREEFVIAKVQDDAALEEEEQYDKFMLHQLDPICANDPIMQLLIYKVRDMGRSIELLVSLDRIPDMWRMVKDSNVRRISLNVEFLSEVITEFDKYSLNDFCEQEKLSLEITEIPALEAVNSVIEQNIFEQMTNTNDPFLLKGFEDYLPIHSESFRSGAIDSRKMDGNFVSARELNVFERLTSGSFSILPSRRVLKLVLSKILDSRYQGANKLVKDIMVAEYNLEKHLRLMRSVYMMETGHVMNKFYQLLFTEIESNPTWNNPNSLTNILEEILAQEWPETSSRWSIVVHEVRTHQVLTAIDKITLHYAIGWPICMVLNADILLKYNDIFRFQLKLKWALWTLDHLRFSDLEGHKTEQVTDRLQHFQARRLESLRFWLIHAIGSIHSYLSGQVLQTLGFMLDRALSEADNLDTIIRVHNEYLKKVHEHCLQTPQFEDLTATITNLLEMCMHVRDRWKRGAKKIIGSDLDTMESSYIKYHTYLALALHNAVQHKDADYYKLTLPQVQCFCSFNDDLEDAEYELEEMEVDPDHQMTELSRNLLTEVAYQSLPPSGIPVPIPKYMIIKEKNRELRTQGLAVQLHDRLDVNDYEHMFSYLRWYYHDEQLKKNAMNTSADFLCAELDEIIRESEKEEL